MPISGVITGCAEGFDDFLRSGLDEPDPAAEGIGAVFCEETKQNEITADEMRQFNFGRNTCGQ